jgi:hypothetical protein
LKAEYQGNANLPGFVDTCVANGHKGVEIRKAIVVQFSGHMMTVKPSAQKPAYRHPLNDYLSLPANISYKIVWKDSGYDAGSGQAPEYIDMGIFWWVLGGAKRSEVSHLSCRASLYL